MASRHRIRFPAIISVLFIVLLVSAVLISSPAATVRAASGWEKQATGLDESLGNGLISVSAASAKIAWAVGWQYADNKPYDPIILKTSNGGHSWIKQSTEVTGILYGVHAVDAKTVWAVGIEMASSDQWPYHPYPTVGLILRTTDGGAHWARRKVPSLNIPSTWIRFIGVDAIDKNTAFVTGAARSTVESGYEYREVIGRTTNGGATWTLPYKKQVFPAENTQTTYLSGISIASAKVIYANGFGTVLKSRNGGRSWAVIRRETAPSIVMKVSAVDEKTAWLVVGALSAQTLETPSTKVLKTTNGGKTWARKLETGDVTSIAPAGAKVAWATGYHCIYKTKNGGNTWAVQYSENPSGYNLYLMGFQGIAAFDSGNAWAVGTIAELGLGTILHTADGGGAGLPLTSLKSIKPDVGSEGSEVVLKGSHFGSSQGTSFVAFRGVGIWTVQATDYSLWSDTEIRCTVPALPAQQVMVSVQTYMMSKPLPFTFTEPVPPAASSTAPK